MAICACAATSPEALSARCASGYTSWECPCRWARPPARNPCSRRCWWSGISSARPRRELRVKAILHTQYGPPDVLQLREVSKPTPKDNEVLIKVHAATAATPDSELRRLKLPLFYAIALRLYIGFIKPTRIKILGTEFAGEIEAVGKDVSAYKPGDQVFGYTGLIMGTYAEYLCRAQNSSGMAGVIGNKPGNLSYVEAAAVPFGGLEALHTLGKANIRPGQKVLIVGAGGSIGS